MDRTGSDLDRGSSAQTREGVRGTLALTLPILGIIACTMPAEAQFSFGFGGSGNRSLSTTAPRQGGGGYGGQRMPAGPHVPGGYGGRAPAAGGTGMGAGMGGYHPGRPLPGGVRVPGGRPGGYGEAGPVGRPPQYPQYPPHRPTGGRYPYPYPGRPGPWVGGYPAPGYPPPVGYPPPYRPPVVVEQPEGPPRMGPRVRPMQPPRAVAAPIAPPPRRGAPARPAPVPPPPSVAAAERSFVDREVLVEVSGTLDDAAIGRMAARHGLTRLASQPLSLTGSTVVRLRVNGRRSVDQAVAALGADAQVLSAQRNHIYRLTQSHNGVAYFPLAPNQYAASKLHLPEAHQLATGEGVLVAVIDSGVDGSHPELQGAIGASENTLSSQARPDLHGTGIAGVIAARSQLMGVAPRTRLIAIRAFAPASGRTRAEGSSYDIIRAVDIAAKSGARVVNMSFAGPADRLMARLLASGLQRGMVFVAAAGNGGAAAPAAYPAAEPGVIAVTATDPQDKLYTSANRGPYIAMAAPGVDVLVATPGGAYGTTSGTSVAAAHVSGIVALMLQRDGGLSPAAVRERLSAEATDLGPAGPDPEFGAGLVDAYAALAGRAQPPVAAVSAPSAPVMPAAASGPVSQGTPPPPPPTVPVVAADPASTVPVAAPVSGLPPPPPPAAAPSVQGSPPPPPAPVASADPAATAPAAPAPAAAPRPAANPGPTQVSGSPPPPPAMPASPSTAGTPPPPPVASADPAAPVPTAPAGTPPSPPAPESAPDASPPAAATPASPSTAPKPTAAVAPSTSAPISSQPPPPPPDVAPSVQGNPPPPPPEPSKP